MELSDNNYKKKYLKYKKKYLNYKLKGGALEDDFIINNNSFVLQIIATFENNNKDISVLDCPSQDTSITYIDFKNFIIFFYNCHKYYSQYFTKLINHLEMTYDKLKDHADINNNKKFFDNFIKKIKYYLFKKILNNDRCDKECILFDDNLACVVQKSLLLKILPYILNNNNIELIDLNKINSLFTDNIINQKEREILVEKLDKYNEYIKTKGGECLKSFKFIATIIKDKNDLKKISSIDDNIEFEINQNINYDITNFIKMDAFRDDALINIFTYKQLFTEINNNLYNQNIRMLLTSYTTIILSLYKNKKNLSELLIFISKSAFDAIDQIVYPTNLIDLPKNIKNIIIKLTYNEYITTKKFYEKIYINKKDFYTIIKDLCNNYINQRLKKKYKIEYFLEKIFNLIKKNDSKTISNKFMLIINNIYTSFYMKSEYRSYITGFKSILDKLNKMIKNGINLYKIYFTIIELDAYINTYNIQSSIIVYCIEKKDIITKYFETNLIEPLMKNNTEAQFNILFNEILFNIENPNKTTQLICEDGPQETKNIFNICEPNTVFANYQCECIEKKYNINTSDIIIKQKNIQIDMKINESTSINDFIQKLESFPFQELLIDSIKIKVIYLDRFMGKPAGVYELKYLIDYIRHIQKDFTLIENLSNIIIYFDIYEDTLPMIYNIHIIIKKFLLESFFDRKLKPETGYDKIKEIFTNQFLSSKNDLKKLSSIDEIIIVLKKLASNSFIYLDQFNGGKHGLYNVDDLIEYIKLLIDSKNLKSQYRSKSETKINPYKLPTIYGLNTKIENLLVNAPI
jgi:hypothetical protein